MAESKTGAVHDMTGGCLCGAVRFSVTLPKREFGVCHCGTCRKWTAGPFPAVEVEDFKVEEDSRLGIYRSSEWAERGFCQNCGTSLFYRLIGKDWYAVSVEALDDSTGFVFSQQIFVDEKPAYYDFANQTKNMTGAEVFAAFGASEDRAAQAGERSDG